MLDNDKIGFKFEFDYDKSKDEYYTMVEYPSGMIKEILHDRDGAPIRIDVNGRTVKEYKKSGRTVTVTDEKGRETAKEYDEFGNLKKIVHPDGTVARYEYDLRFNLVAHIRDERETVTNMFYDDNGNLVRKVGAAGTDIERTTVYEYDDDGNPEVIRRLGDVYTAEAVTVMAYDGAGNMTSITDPEQGTAYFTDHDAMGNVLEKTDARGKSWSYAHDGNGRLKTVTDPFLHVTRYDYDGAGNLEKTTDAELKETVYGYDPRNNLVLLTDANSHDTVFEYDRGGNLTRREDAGGREMVYEWDTEGRMTAQIDGNENRTAMKYDTSACPTCSGVAVGKPDRIEYPTFARELKYDARGRVEEEIDILDESDVYTAGYKYDRSGNLTEKTDRENKVTKYRYDELNRLERVTQTVGGVEQFTDYIYDNRDNLVALSDASKKTTWFEYDREHSQFLEKDNGSGRGRTGAKGVRKIFFRTSASGASGNRRRETWRFFVILRLLPLASACNMAKNNFRTPKGEKHFSRSTDPAWFLNRISGNHECSQYDRNNRLVKEIRPMGEETTYGYDAAGNLQWKIDAKNQKTEYVYDDAGRMTDVLYFAAAEDETPVKTVTFGYDRVGNLTSYDDGTTSGVYAYDNLYQKTSESVDYCDFSLSYSHEYYDNGTKKSYTGPDNTTYTYVYDNNNRLANITIPGAGVMAFDSYKWNRPESVTLPGGTTRKYEYDPLMRVKKITSKDRGGNVIMDYDYAYDRMDNIVTKNTEHGVYSYGYDDLYQLTSADNPGQMADEAYTYDPVGNRKTAAGIPGEWTVNDNNELVSYNGVALAYDDNGNTVRKNDNGVEANYVYNIEDRMERVEDGTGAEIAEYYYDPFGRRLWKDVAGTRTYFHYTDEGLVGEYDASGNEIKTYGWKPNSIWTTDPLFMKVGLDYYFYHNDHLGTPQKMTALNGEEVWRAEYSSFGIIKLLTIDIVNNLRFSGQYYDNLRVRSFS